MSTIYEPHVCDRPESYKFNSIDSAVPRYVRGTIWRCDECGHYWHYVTHDGFAHWGRVRFWNLIHKHRIRKATR